MSIVLEPLIYGTLGNRRYISAKCNANNIRAKIFGLKNVKYVYGRGFYGMIYDVKMPFGLFC